MSPPVIAEEQTAVAQVCMGKSAPSEGAGPPGVVPANGIREARVLYLFAGARRRSGLAKSLRIACKDTGIRVVVDEIDILRGGRQHDLLRRAYREKIMAKVRQGYYQLAAASPPCGTFSRSRSANNRGPKPIRSKAFPLGFPWLQGSSLMQARCANTLVDFTAEVLAAQMETSPGLTILEHPEDLGKTGKDVPGSIWQLAKIRALESQGEVDTGAIRQSDFGTAYQKPTRLLGRLPGLAGHMFVGWPCFDEEGHYTGPLPKFTGTAARLIGRKGNSFKTTDTAAWPERLCHLLARLAIAAVRNSAQAEALTKGVCGGDAGEDSAATPDPGGQPREDDGGVTDVVPRGAPSRRRITQAELDTLANGNKLKDDVMYVGRGGRGSPRQNGGTLSR